MIRLRVFVASPGDVEDERNRSSVVVEAARRGVARRLGVDLEAVRWETHVRPGVGEDAQDVINKQIGKYDIFVGIMWKRLGTRTRRSESGTKEEFEAAYENYKRFRKPEIMWYFCTKPFYPADLNELIQMRKVLKFKKKLEELGVFFLTYAEPLDFERMFREHLENHIYEITEDNEIAYGVVLESAASAFTVHFDRTDERDKKALRNLMRRLQSVENEREVVKVWRDDRVLEKRMPGFVEKKIIEKATGDGGWPGQVSARARNKAIVQGIRDALDAFLRGGGQ